MLFGIVNITNYRHYCSYDCHWYHECRGWAPACGSGRFVRECRATICNYYAVKHVRPVLHRVEFGRWPLSVETWPLPILVPVPRRMKQNKFLLLVFAKHTLRLSSPFSSKYQCLSPRNFACRMYMYMYVRTRSRSSWLSLSWKLNTYMLYMCVYIYIHIYVLGSRDRACSERTKRGWHKRARRRLNPCLCASDGIAPGQSISKAAQIMLNYKQQLILIYCRKSPMQYIKTYIAI